MESIVYDQYKEQGDRFTPIRFCRELGAIVESKFLGLVSRGELEEGEYELVRFRINLGFNPDRIGVSEDTMLRDVDTWSYAWTLAWETAADIQERCEWKVAYALGKEGEWEDYRKGATLYGFRFHYISGENFTKLIVTLVRF